MDNEHSSRTTYLAYMLRLWLAGSRGGRPVWRASLENPHTGELLTFGDAKALFAFLVERTNSVAETVDADGNACPPTAGGTPAA